MSKRRIVILLAMAMMAAGTTLTGCSGSSSTTASAPAAPAKTADVRISAVFPGTATTSAVKSLLPADTQAIEVYAQPQTSGTYVQPTLIATLTKASPSATVKLAPGNYYFHANAFATTDTTTYRMALASTYTGGVLNAGSNTVNLTFLNGQWTLVNASDVATPLVLSNGTQLRDVVIGGEYYQGTPVKAAIDFNKPFGSGGGMMRYRFDNNSSAHTTGGMYNQFIGTANELVLHGGHYNLTQKCGDYYHYMSTPCETKTGDQMLFIPGMDSYSSSSGSSESTLLYGNAEALLPNKGATLLTQNGSPFTLEGKYTVGTVTGGTVMSGSLIEFLVSNYSETLNTTPSPAATAAKTATSKVLKAQSANTPYSGITATDYKMMICATTANPKQGGWVFQSTQKTIGSATCYDNGYLSGTNCTYDQTKGTTVCTYDAGDFSYGLAPADPANLGDYCHQWDYQQTKYNPTTQKDEPNPTYNTCLQQKPGTGDVYNPYRFTAVKTDTKTAISYGSFKLNHHVQRATSGTANIYNFRAKGNATVSPAPTLK